MTSTGAESGSPRESVQDFLARARAERLAWRKERQAQAQRDAAERRAEVERMTGRPPAPRGLGLSPDDPAGLDAEPWGSVYGAPGDGGDAEPTGDATELAPVEAIGGDELDADSSAGSDETSSAEVNEEPAGDAEPRTAADVAAEVEETAVVPEPVAPASAETPGSSPAPSAGWSPAAPTVLPSQLMAAMVPPTSPASAPAPAAAAALPSTPTPVRAPAPAPATTPVGMTKPVADPSQPMELDFRKAG